MCGGPPPPPEHRNEIGVGSWNHETTELWEQDTELRFILKWESTIHEPLRAGSQPRVQGTDSQMSMTSHSNVGRAERVRRYRWKAWSGEALEGKASWSREKWFQASRRKKNLRHRDWETQMINQEPTGQPIPITPLRLWTVLYKTTFVTEWWLPLPSNL